jgi:hypothetical protein
VTWDLRRRAEIKPVKDSHTRIKPLALNNGHGSYITAYKPLHPNGHFSCWRTAVTYNRYKFITVSILKRFSNGRSNTWTQKRFKISAGTVEIEL